MTLPIQIHVGSIPTPRRYTGWRCIHTIEGGRFNPPGQPAVRNAINARNIPFTRSRQLLAFDINQPYMTREKFHALYKDRIAFTDGEAWDTEPRTDYVNGLNLKPENLPQLMKAIICAGMFLPHAQKIGNEIECVPGRDGIDVNKQLPTVSEVLERGWYFHAVHSASNPFHFVYNGTDTGGNVRPVLIPYFLEVPVRYPAEWFAWWDAESKPDPIGVYLPRVAVDGW